MLLLLLGWSLLLLGCFLFLGGLFLLGGLLLGGLLFLLGWPSNVFSSRLLPANKTSKCV